MSDEGQAVSTSPQPDDSEPTPERQTELRAAYMANVAAGKAPYWHVSIRTRGELQWVMQEHNWSGEWNVGEKERAILTGAILTGGVLAGARLCMANLSGADLRDTNLRGAYLPLADLSGARLGWADLGGADLRSARMDATTNLYKTRLDARTLLADVVWNDAPVTRVNWAYVYILGDERVAHQRRDDSGKQKDASTRLTEYQDAVMASRQVATLLRSQGLNEPGDRFAYRAQVLQRQVLTRQGCFGAAFGSWLLDAVAGYGYKPMRSVWTYVAVILTFAAAYFSISNFSVTPFLPTLSTPLAWYEALVLSISSFHGRGLFPTGLSLGDPVAILAAGEAIIGLLIEITFIATFTQRFFAR